MLNIFSRIKNDQVRVPEIEVQGDRIRVPDNDPEAEEQNQPQRSLKLPKRKWF